MQLSVKNRMYQHGEYRSRTSTEYHNSSTYLLRSSVLLTQDNELKAKKSRRMQLTNKCYFGTGTLLKYKSISLNLKI